MLQNPQYMIDFTHNEKIMTRLLAYTHDASILHGLFFLYAVEQQVYIVRNTALRVHSLIRISRNDLFNY